MSSGTSRVTATRAGPRSGVAGVALELGFVAAALLAYLLVRWWVDGRDAEAVRNAERVLAWQEDLGLAWERSVQDAAARVDGLVPLLNQFYVWGYFPVVLGSLVWFYVRHRATYPTLRNALLASGAVGLLCYGLFPCAPPRLVPAGIADTMHGGALASVARPSLIANELGAMPSFHVGWLMLVCYLVHRVTRSALVRTWCVLHPLVMSYAVVATGNHWVLDIPAGALLPLVGLAGAGLVARVRSDPRAEA